MVVIGKFTVVLSFDLETVDLAEIRIHGYDSLGNSYSSRPTPARPARPRSVPLMTHLVSLLLIMVMLPVSNVSTLPAVRYTLTAAGKVPCLIWNESKDLHASFEAPSKHRPCLKLKVEPLSWTLLSMRSQATRRLCLNITFILRPFHW